MNDKQQSSLNTQFNQNYCQLQMDESLIEGNQEMSLMSECNNIGDEPSDIIRYFGDQTLVEGKFYEGQERMELSCLFLDIEQENATQFFVELNNDNIPQALQGVFDGIEDLFNEIIKERTYELEKGVIIFKYQIRKKKQIITKKYPLKMERIGMKKEQQLSCIVKYLKAKQQQLVDKKIEKQIQKLLDEPKDLIVTYQKVISQNQQQIASCRSYIADLEEQIKVKETNMTIQSQQRRQNQDNIKEQGLKIRQLEKTIEQLASMTQSQSAQLTYLKKVCSQYCATLLENQGKVEIVPNTIEETEASVVFERKVSLIEYFKKKLQKIIDTETSYEIHQFCIAHNILLSDEPLLKESITSNYLAGKEFNLLNNYFKKNTKTQIQLQLAVSNSNNWLVIKGFKHNSDYSLEYYKTGSICIIEVDRFLDKVSLIVDGNCKEREDLSKYVMDREFQVNIGLSFVYSQTKLKVDIKRNDFVIGAV